VFVIVSREFPNDQVASASASFFNEVQLLFSRPPLPFYPACNCSQATNAAHSHLRRGSGDPTRETGGVGIRGSGSGSGTYGGSDSVAFSALWHVHDSLLRFVFLPFAVKGIQISRFGEFQVENALIGH